MGISADCVTGLPPGTRVKALAVATTVALLCLPGARDAYAQSIGALDVRSRIGERFFGAVPVRMDSGVLDPRCIRVMANPTAPDGAEALQNARVRIGSADSVIIETAGAVNSPIVGVRLEVGCGNTVSRDFVVLSDVPSDATPSQASAADAGATASATAPAAPAVVAATTPRRPTTARAPAARRAPPVESPALPAGEPTGAPTAAPVTRATPPAAVPTNTGVASNASNLQSQNAKRLAELQARSDDQAAALLALEDRLALLQKQADLLKLQLEQALAQTPASPQPAQAGAQSTITPDAPAAAPSTPAASVSSPVATAPAKAAPAPVAQIVQTSPRKEPGVLDLLFDWRVSGGIAALLLGAFAFKLRRRPMLATEQRKARLASETQSRPMTPLAAEVDPSMFDKTGEYPVASSFGAQSTAEWPSALQPPAKSRTAEWVPPASEPPTTDNFPLPEPSMTTSQIMRASPASMSREHHITQQFQPNTERVVALSSPEEIVQQARTHYMDDGDLFRAIDLLEMAVSVRKDSPRPWQALFAIYRRENMPERFQRLVLAYRSTFGEDENWPAVQALGRAMDPDNRLYAGANSPDKLPEDLLERWLGVPLDFTAHLLANEMHDQLMSTNPGRKRRRNLAQ